jgi:hypothetical protein
VAPHVELVTAPSSVQEQKAGYRVKRKT